MTRWYPQPTNPVSHAETMRRVNVFREALQDMPADVQEAVKAWRERLAFPILSSDDKSLDFADAVIAELIWKNWFATLP